MKIRRGFVSNSSSSSFFLATTKDNYDKMMETADDAMKEVANEMAEFPDEEFLGKKMVIFREYSDHGGEGTFSIMEVKAEDPYEAWDRIKTALCKNSSEVITASCDW